nr:hypothetical protein [Tanacetum cinerariifolium]
MLILDEFLTAEIRATDDYKEYETVFVNVAVPMNQPQSGKKMKQSDEETSSPRESLKVTIKKKKHNTTLLKHKNVAKVQEKLAEEEIEKMVEGEEDEESYASEFADSMFNDDDDFGTRIEPKSHKENPKVVDKDEVNDKVNQDEKKNDDAEKMDDAAKEKDNDDHIDHTLVGSGSMETRNEQMQTSILTPTRYPRKDLSSNKTIFKELTETVSPTTATTSKNKIKRGFTSNKTKILPESIAGMCRRCG